MATVDYRKIAILKTTGTGTHWLQPQAKDEKLIVNTESGETYLVRTIGEQAHYSALMTLYGMCEAHRAHLRTWQYMGQDCHMLVWRLRKSFN